MCIVFETNATSNNLSRCNMADEILRTLDPRSPLRVTIHYCLTGSHKGQWSVTDRRPGQPRRVIAHVSEAVLHGATFHVSETQRQWVLTHHRQVHAVVLGMWTPQETASPTPQRITYNPYEAPTFTHITADGTRGTAIHSADRVVFSHGRAYV
jgi:hypothetical protein